MEGIILVIVIIGGVLIYSAIRNNLPESSSHVKIISKNISVQGEHTTTRYHISFELDNGSRMTREANSKQYGVMLEGETGLLTYTDYDVKSFVRD